MGLLIVLSRPWQDYATSQDLNVMSEYSETHSACCFQTLGNHLLIISGRYVSSTELVPGDVYEVTDPALTQFPCDSILLAGDCIVNESMLTGIIPIIAVPIAHEI